MKINPRDLCSKKECHNRFEEHVDELGSLQRLRYASKGHALPLMFRGMDDAGQDCTFRQAMSGAHPQGCEIFSVRQPSVAR